MISHNASARNSPINNGPTSLADDPAVKQAEADSKREPEDTGENAQNAEARGRDVPTLLQANHLRVVRRQGRAD